MVLSLNSSLLCDCGLQDGLWWETKSSCIYCFHKNSFRILTLMCRTLVILNSLSPMFLFFSYTKFLKILANINNGSYQFDFSGLLWTFVRIFHHFWLISDLEAFTFVNRESALHSRVLYAYVELVSSTILYAIYTCVCFIWWNVSYNSESWKIEMEMRMSQSGQGKEPPFRWHIFHPFSHVFFLRTCAYGLVENLFGFLPFSFTLALGDTLVELPH